MRKIMFSILCASIATISFGQVGPRINFYSAYTFDDGYDVVTDGNTYYNGTLKGGYQWGAGVEYIYNPRGGVEILYLHRGTTAPTTFRFGANTPVKTEDFDVVHDYIMLAGDGHFAKGKTEGYAGLMAGVLISNLEAPSLGKAGSHTNFAWGARLGTNIWVSQSLGVKLQASILSSSKATGGEFWWGWYGYPLYVTTYSTIWQFSLGGGLTYRLGK